MRNPWSYKHGHHVGRKATPEYSAYRNAKSRCTNERAVQFPYYGGRGIEFRFNSFQEFLNDIGLRPSQNHSLDRIDVNGHYEVGNIRWATKSEQQFNVRRNIKFTLDGKTRSLREWMARTGYARSTLLHRRDLGWCDRCILTLPVKPGVRQYCVCI